MRRPFLLLPLLLVPVLCRAGLLWQGSAFYPEVRSAFSPSQLADNGSYWQGEPQAPDPGLRHPFRTWRELKSGVAEVFLPGQPRYSLLQYAYRDSSLEFKGELNIQAGYDYRSEEDGGYGFLWKGFRLNSAVNDRLRLRAWWWMGAFFGDLDAAEGSPLIDGYHTRLAKRTQLDNLNADLSYRDRHLTAALGRGKFEVGNSLSGSLILSDLCNDYGYLLAEGRAGAFTLSLLHGSLIADSTSTRLADDDYPDKYVALHQLTYRHRGWLELFGGEAIIYGNRGLDLNYLLPHTFWRVTEHNQRDRDNVLIYGGVNLRPATGATAWLNLMLDELRYKEILGNWWGNKYALQTGISFPLSLLPGQPRLGAEFTAVRPWTYAHYTNHTMYSQDGRPLGYPKGSNLIDFTAELNYPLFSGLRWDCRASFTRQGSVGSDWRLNYQDYFPPGIIDTATADWLEGEITDTFTIQNSLRIGLMAHHSFVLGHTSTHTDAWSHSLFGGWQLSY
jgi:hypothetical protein